MVNKAVENWYKAMQEICADETESNIPSLGDALCREVEALQEKLDASIGIINKFLEAGTVAEVNELKKAVVESAHDKQEVNP
jgi:hypothetical protein